MRQPSIPECRPKTFLAAYGRKYPDAWKQADMFRAVRGQGLPGWPPWCFLPMAAWYNIVSSALHANPLPLDKIGDVGILNALGTWRVTQGIYRFDPTLYDAVYATPLDKELPCDILYRMPEWCVYVETPGAEWLGIKLYGFFALLEYDVNESRSELRFVFDTDQGSYSTPLHLGSWTLKEAYQRMIDISIRNGAPAREFGDLAGEMSSNLYPFVSLVIYLCSDDAFEGLPARPQRPRPQKTRNGIRMFAPDNHKVWDIGIRMGQAIRTAADAAKQQPAGETGGTHAAPRPHIRRAHWHLYRVGVKREETRVRWLFPIPVNVKSHDELPAVIRPVKE